MNKLIDKILKENKLGEKRPIEAAGALIICPQTQRALINLRGKDCDEPNTWATFGGGVDETDSSITNAVRREVFEEAGYDGEMILTLAYIHKETNFTFYNYLGFVEEEFTPKINDESENYAWCNWEELWEIEPKHPGFYEFLENAGTILKPFMAPKQTSSLTETILKEAS